jgi:hypothetical protein
MRGGFVHSKAIAVEIAAVVRQHGGRVWFEYPIRPGSRSQAVDVRVEIHGFQIACEIELGPQRVLNDLHKAEFLGVDLLLIVTPTSREAMRIARLLKDNKSRIRVQVMHFGAALGLLSDKSSLDSLLNEGTNTRSKQREART